MGGRSSTTGQVVAVFGATGFIGRYLVSRLGRTGTQVVVPFRGEMYNARMLKPMGDLGQIVPLRFDLRDEQSIAECVRNATVVVNLIGQDRKTFNFTIQSANVDGALRIARICRAEGIPRLIHVSHLQASATSKSEHMRAKWAAEQELREKYYDRTVIVRPAHVFGHEDRFLNLIGTLGQLPLGYPLLNHGKAIRYPIYVGDLAGAIVRMCQARGIEGSTFDLCAQDALSMRDLHDLFVHTTLHKRRLLNLSPRLFWLYSKLYPEYRRSILPLDTVYQMLEDEVPDALHSTFATLGMQKLRTLQESILEYVRIFRRPEDFAANVELPPHAPLTAASAETRKRQIGAGSSQ